MSLGRTYTVTSGPYTVAATSATPILMCSTSATVTVDVQAFRVGSVSGPSVNWPANSTADMVFARPSNSPVVGSANLTTPAPHNPSDIAANSVWSIGSIGGGTAWTTAPTLSAGGGTSGQTGWLWSQPVPMAAGAGWGEWVNPGAEWRIPASAFAAFFVICSTAGSATQYQVQAIFTE
jgi:hypothetical protein